MSFAEIVNQETQQIEASHNSTVAAEKRVDQLRKAYEIFLGPDVDLEKLNTLEAQAELLAKMHQKEREAYVNRYRKELGDQIDSLPDCSTRKETLIRLLDEFLSKVEKGEVNGKKELWILGNWMTHVVGYKTAIAEKKAMEKVEELNKSRAHLRYVQNAIQEVNSKTVDGELDLTWHAKASLEVNDQRGNVMATLVQLKEINDKEGIGIAFPLDENGRLLSKYDKNQRKVLMDNLQNKLEEINSHNQMMMEEVKKCSNERDEYYHYARMILKALNDALQATARNTASR